jgi:hypothetical protein
MFFKRPTSPIIDFFLKAGITQGLFKWLTFRLYIAEHKGQLSSTESPSTSVVEQLIQWQSQVSFIAPAMGVLRVLSMVAALLGFVAMAGVLNYSQDQLINIWIPLALFAFIPLLMTLMSVYFSVLSTTRQALHGHPLILVLVTRLKLTHFLPYKNVLLPWLFWQLQFIAIVFSLSALVSFFVLATFQDYRFGWSSTLITDNTTMTHLFSVLSWPWHWLIESPSFELVSQSRFSAHTPLLSTQLDNTWWLTLVMAMVIYGVLPRVLLTFFLRKRCVQQLRDSIENSSDVEQFIVSQQHQTSLNPIQSNETLNDNDEVFFPQETCDVITWQHSTFDFPVVKNLGSAEWLEDEQWLNSPNSIREKPVWVVVEPAQTPTGELADCIALLQEHNGDIALVLYPINSADSRYQYQHTSWQYFAKRHAIELKQGFSNV